MDDTPVPPALKQLAPILKHAAQVRAQVPVMSYLCSLYGIQLGLKIKGTDPASKAFLVGLMDRLERQRAELGPALGQVDQKAFATNFAVKVFGHADDEYRAGLATRETAKNFYSATVFFDVLRQFDPLPEEIENMRKYAKYSAVVITKAIKQGLPVVHPDSQDTQDSFGGDGGDGQGDLDPFSAAAGFPTILSPSSGSPSMSAQSQPYYGSGGSPTHPPYGGGGPSVTQPTPFGHGGFDIPSVPSSAHPSRTDTTPPSSYSMSPSGPAHGFPSSFVVDNNSGYPAAPAPASQPPPSPQQGGGMDSIDQLLSLFPTVPASSSSSSPAPGLGGRPTGNSSGGAGAGGSGGGSPNMSWSPSPSFPSHGHPSATSPAASQPQPRPSSGSPAHAPAPAQAPARAAPAQAPAPASAPRTGPGSFAPSPANLEQAQKFARFAVSALQFEDIPYAVQNLQQALALLTGKQYD